MFLLGSTQCSPLGCGLTDSDSSCTRLNPQLLCCLDVNLKRLQPEGGARRAHGAACAGVRRGACNRHFWRHSRYWFSLIRIPRKTLCVSPGQHPVVLPLLCIQSPRRLLVYETKPAATVLSGCQPEGPQPEGGAQDVGGMEGYSTGRSEKTNTSFLTSAEGHGS